MKLIYWSTSCISPLHQYLMDAIDIVGSDNKLYTLRTQSQFMHPHNNHLSPKNTKEPTLIILIM